MPRLALRDESPCDEIGHNPRVLHSCPFTLPPPTPLETCSDLCRDLGSLFTLTHAFPPHSEETAPKFHVHYKSFSRGPRLPARPRLDCRDCCLAAPGSCGVGVRLTERGSGGCSSCLIKYMFPVLTCQARGPYCSRPRMKDSPRSPSAPHRQHG